MAVTSLQSNLVPISTSVDSGTTWLNIVCKKGWTFNHETSTTEEETDCGTLTGVGSNKWSFDVEGVMSTTPGAGEASAETLLGYASAQTLLLIRTQYPTSGSPGTDLYASGSADLTNFRITNSVGSLMNFSATFSGTGRLDITA